MRLSFYCSKMHRVVHLLLTGRSLTLACVWTCCGAGREGDGRNGVTCIAVSAHAPAASAAKCQERSSGIIVMAKCLFVTLSRHPSLDVEPSERVLLALGLAYTYSRNFSQVPGRGDRASLWFCTESPAFVARNSRGMPVAAVRSH